MSDGRGGQRKIPSLCERLAQVVYESREAVEEKERGGRLRLTLHLMRMSSIPEDVPLQYG